MSHNPEPLEKICLDTIIESIYNQRFSIKQKLSLCYDFVTGFKNYGHMLKYIENCILPHLFKRYVINLISEPLENHTTYIKRKEKTIKKIKLSDFQCPFLEKRCYLTFDNSIWYLKIHSKIEKSFAMVKGKKIKSNFKMIWSYSRFPQHAMSTSNENINPIFCIFCMKNIKTAIYFPCAHFLTCIECTLSIDHCPICKKYIEGVAIGSFLNENKRNELLYDKEKRGELFSESERIFRTINKIDDIISIIPINM